MRVIAPAESPRAVRGKLEFEILVCGYVLVGDLVDV